MDTLHIHIRRVSQPHYARQAAKACVRTTIAKKETPLPGRPGSPLLDPAKGLVNVDLRVIDLTRLGDTTAPAFLSYCCIAFLFNRHNLTLYGLNDVIPPSLLLAAHWVARHGP